MALKFKRVSKTNPVTIKNSPRQKKEPQDLEFRPPEESKLSAFVRNNSQEKLDELEAILKSSSIKVEVRKDDKQENRPKLPKTQFE